jgi:hypothetical protein
MAKALPCIMLQVYIMFLSNQSVFTVKFNFLKVFYRTYFFPLQCDERMKISNLINMFIFVIYLTEDRCQVFEIQTIRLYLNLQ